MARNKAIKLGCGSITLPRNVAIGDLIVVHVGANAPVEALTITSPRVTGNFVLQINSDLTKPNRGAIYAGVATSAGACTITNASGNLSFSQIWAGVILTGTIPADVTGTAYSAAGSAGNTGTAVVTTGTNRVVIAGVVGWHDGTVFAAVGTYVDFDYIGGSDAMGVIVMNAPTAGSYTPVMSQSDRDNNPLCIAAFAGTYPPADGNVMTQLATEVAAIGESQAVMTQMAVEVAIRLDETETPVSDYTPVTSVTPIYDGCR
jgi:hypothetical protein